MSGDDPVGPEPPDENGDLDDRGNPDDRGDRADGDDAPLGDIARRVKARSESRDSDSRDRSDPFEAVDVGEVDTEDLWASLDAEGSTASDTGIPTGDPTEPDSDLGGTEPVEELSDPTDTRPEHVLDKREYCQRCPYFTAPPTVACDNDGTDIVEVVDSGHFRVRGCPMATTDGKPNFAIAEGGDETAVPRSDAADGAPVTDTPADDA